MGVECLVQCSAAALSFEPLLENGSRNLKGLFCMVGLSLTGFWGVTDLGGLPLYYYCYYYILSLLYCTYITHTANKENKTLVN